jgi:hypothetical protein
LSQKAIPTQRVRSCTVAISQTTEKRKMAAKQKKLTEFLYDLPQTAYG